MPLRSHPDAEVAALIVGRRGWRSAISVDEIGKALWPERWELGGADGEKQRRNVRDAIKKAVSRLVNDEDLMILSSRGEFNGYFMAESKEEVDHAVQPLVQQAIKMLKRARKLTGDPYYDELSGQLSLKL